MHNAKKIIVKPKKIPHNQIKKDWKWMPPPPRNEKTQERQTVGRGREKKNMWCKNVLELEILDTDNRNQKNLTQNARNEV